MCLHRSVELWAVLVAARYGHVCVKPVCLKELRLQIDGDMSCGRECSRSCCCCCCRYKLIEEKLQLSQYLDWTFVSCAGPMRVSAAPAAAGGSVVALWSALMCLQYLELAWVNCRLPLCACDELQRTLPDLRCGSHHDCQLYGNCLWFKCKL
jgi:hypothetical protein